MIVLIDIIERVLRRIKWNVNGAKSIKVIFLVFYLVIQKTVQTVEQRLNSSLLYQWRWVNPLHPNISMHILHTVCSTFPKVLTRRNCWTIGRASLVSDYFLYFHDLNVWLEKSLLTKGYFLWNTNFFFLFCEVIQNNVEGKSFSSSQVI